MEVSLTYKRIRSATAYMKKQSGFSLVELTIVLVVIGLMMSMILPASTAFVDLQRRRETSSKLTNVDTALLAFVITNKRLPCPADGTVVSGTADAGTEMRSGTTCTAQTTGVVPWATLGLTEADITDGWGARFTYRVPDGASGLTMNSSLDVTACDPSGALNAAASSYSCVASCDHSAASLSACTSSASMFLNRGLRVVDQSGTLNDPATSTGAAYVFIVPMAEGGGGYSAQGTLLNGSIAAGTGEARNKNGQGIPAIGYFHSSQIVGLESTDHFDDLLSHPTMAMIVTKAGLLPRH